MSVLGDFFPPCRISCCLRELRFTLLKQRLLELVRKGKTDEALNFAAERLAPEGAGDPVTLRQIEEAVTLLAFEVRCCYFSRFSLKRPTYIAVGETVAVTVGETAGQTATEAVGETVDETVDETMDETVGGIRYISRGAASFI